MAGLTLLESCKLKNDPLQMGVVETFARESVVLEHLPFLETASDSYSWNREQALGGADFRSINSDYSDSVGSLDRVTENLVILGGKSKVDRALVKTSASSINDVRYIFDSMKSKAVALKFTKVFLKGDCESNPLEFDGLQARCAGDQLISAGSTGGGNPLSLTKLDEAMDAVKGGCDLLLMNKKMGRRMSAAARTNTVAGDVQYTVDQFGKSVMQYNGVKIGLIDKDENDDDILAFDEACAGGGASTGTSIYCIKFGVGTDVCGLQCGGITVEDLGILNNVQYTTLIEWIVGIGVFGKRSCSRLYSISDAAITA